MKHRMHPIEKTVSIGLILTARYFYNSETAILTKQIRAIALLPPSNAQLATVIEALIHAEDHRFHLHKGFDSIAIVRACFKTIFMRKAEGASTITQQLVRVILHDYRRCLSRKLKEICLAAWLDSKISKEEQAASYLKIAYFGWRMNGINQAVSRLQILLPCDESEAASIIARLKYPQPQHPKEANTSQIRIRQSHIIKKMRQSRENANGT